MTGTSEPMITSREQLVCVLRSAAELEHLLSCQYLFAGFSLRRTLADFPQGGSEDEKRLVMTRNQRWGFKVMQIARQEMEHLGEFIPWCSMDDVRRWRVHQQRARLTLRLDSKFSHGVFIG